MFDLDSTILSEGAVSLSKEAPSTFKLIKPTDALLSRSFQISCVHIELVHLSVSM